MSRHDPRLRAPAGILTADEWRDLRASLRLALAAVGDRPEDFNEAVMLNCMNNQRAAMLITNCALATSRRRPHGVWT